MQVMAPLDEFSQCMTFNVRTAARMITQFYDQRLAPYGLRISQLALLAAIRRHGAASKQALAKAMQLDPSTLTRTLRPLEEKGLIRLESSGRGRGKSAVLTVAGHERYQQCAGAWQRAQADLRAKLGPNGFDELLGGLQSAIVNLSDELHPPEQPEPPAERASATP